MEELLEHDIVLCTYGVLRSEYKNLINNLDPDKLRILHPHAFFHRVILDEAHNIKNKDAQTSNAATMLQAQYRLRMTGTPLMNCTTEVFPLVRFLQIKPYNDWKKFDRKIDRLIVKWSGGSEDRGMRRLQVLLRSIMLRRTKDSMLDGQPILELPLRHNLVMYAEFDAEQKQFHLALESRQRLRFNKYVKAGTVTKNYAEILVLLLRLRQACDHPHLIKDHSYVLEGATNNEDQDSGTPESSDFPEPFPGFHGPTDDREAETDAQRANKNRTVFSSLAAFRSNANNRTTQQHYHQHLRTDWVSSAKVDKIMELLADIRQRSPKEKTLVFSLWPSFLDLVEVAVVDNHFVHNRYDGKMGANERHAAVRDFQENPDVEVMLVSLTAGNAGLNLTAATQVIIVEPFWNPYVEEQAIDRAHRIGQERPVTVHRLLIKGTVEDCILALQEKKKNLVDAALSEEGARAAGKLTVSELQGLFGE